MSDEIVSVGWICAKGHAFSAYSSSCKEELTQGWVNFSL